MAEEPSTEFERGVRDFMKVVKGHVHDIESIGNFKGFCLEFLTERPHTPQRNTQKAKSRILMKLRWVY